eukprot:TRINITY_DN9816_c0_g2_i2.p1 TRINITY_DN9816_c0_g2~~TRINITY_DN9816_c0_g2_i2.p1  ORF type:complete len:112 (-),score=16.17 TRINITY_DN9816_c0_g2_i2:206-541(-)
MLSLLPQAAVVPTTPPCNSAISACGKGNQWQSALHSWNLTLQAKVEVKLLELLWLFSNQLLELQLTHSKLVHYTPDMNACEKAKVLQSALHRLNLMPQATVVPSTMRSKRC